MGRFTRPYPGWQINNDWKILSNPEVGQCDAEIGSKGKGTYLFDLGSDPTESRDVSAAAANQALFANMTQQLKNLHSSIAFSQVIESECMPKTPGPPGPPGPPGYVQ